MFLNQSFTFKKNIDWNFTLYGKLWTYNLNYFDYLHQEETSKDDGLRLIYDFIEQSDKVIDGLEAFPISLRGINWIKFLVKYKIDDTKINDSLYAQYQILMDNIEYHLLGNHLLENGFSLLFSAYYFQDERFYDKAKKILIYELEEQILDDGAHFELSPMYHQIMLFRVLDCINLIKNNNWKNHELLQLFMNKAEIMLGWLNAITYKNGCIPLLNDSSNKIAPTTNELNHYASQLKVKIKNIKLQESGYRMVSNNRYECIIDVGNIGPDYIPGHAHADTFNFELYIDKTPFIVDIGVSTYETNNRRLFERSTVSHNTVEIAGCSQSEVWGGFRVAERAFITQLDERDNRVRAMHNGYEKRLNALHEREFIFENNSINIIDKIISEHEQKAVARIHFHPDVDESMIKQYIQFKNSEYSINIYQYAPEFNVLIDAKVLEIPFTTKLEMRVVL
ncbi:alginate lyase family protein [Sulfurovum sp. TSL1]|uniref:alginate lyase family protein n=1 Tax=Sulfurovum sp. TSL1 TaxID=2826994 RepID=UPI001CC3F7DE|nr:alginate lyase family protein [Sulfurovum sp. TSL1]